MSNTDKYCTEKYAEKKDKVPEQRRGGDRSPLEQAVRKGVMKEVAFPPLPATV